LVQPAIPVHWGEKQVGAAFDGVVSLRSILGGRRDGGKGNDLLGVGERDAQGKHAGRVHRIGAGDVFRPGRHAIAILVGESGGVEIRAPIRVCLVKPPLGRVIGGEVGRIIGGDGMIGQHVGKGVGARRSNIAARPPSPRRG